MNNTASGTVSAIGRRPQQYGQRRLQLHRRGPGEQPRHRLLQRHHSGYANVITGTTGYDSIGGGRETPPAVDTAPSPGAEQHATGLALFRWILQPCDRHSQHRGRRVHQHGQRQLCDDPGGELNLAAGDYALAAGRRAKADSAGSFVWGDSTNADVTPAATTSSSSAPTRPVVRPGHYRHHAHHRCWRLHQHLHRRLPEYGGTWTNASDRNLKANMAPVEGRRSCPAWPACQSPPGTTSARIRRSGTSAHGPGFLCRFGVGEDDSISRQSMPMVWLWPQSRGCTPRIRSSRRKSGRYSSRTLT